MTGIFQIFLHVDFVIAEGRLGLGPGGAEGDLAVRAPLAAPGQHRIEVGADKLGDARAVWVWVTDGSGARRLALATARP